MKDLVEEAAEDIREHLAPLAELKDSPEILDHLKALNAEVKAGER